MAYSSVRHSKKKVLRQVQRFGPSRQAGSAMRRLKVEVMVHRFGDHFDARACWAAKGRDHEFSKNDRVATRHGRTQCGEFIEARSPTKAVSAALKSLANRKR